MSAETQRPALPESEGLKLPDPERLLAWFAQTAEAAIGLDYELNKIRVPRESPTE